MTLHFEFIHRVPDENNLTLKISGLVRLNTVEFIGTGSQWNIYRYLHFYGTPKNLQSRVCTYSYKEVMTMPLHNKLAGGWELEWCDLQSVYPNFEQDIAKMVICALLSEEYNDC